MSSLLVGVFRTLSFDGCSDNVNKGRSAQDVPPTTDPCELGGKVGAWIISCALRESLNPRP